MALIMSVQMSKVIMIHNWCVLGIGVICYPIPAALAGARGGFAMVERSVGVYCPSCLGFRCSNRHLPKKPAYHN